MGRPALLVAAWMAAVLPSSFGSPNSPKDYDKTPEKEPAGTAMCVIDVGQAVISLGMAGTAIQTAATLCHGREKERAPHLCSAAINTVLYMFAYTGTFLSSAATDCARTLSLGAYCAADVTNLIGALAALGAGASGMVESCDLGPELRHLMPDWALPLPHAAELRGTAGAQSLGTSPDPTTPTSTTVPPANSTASSNSSQNASAYGYAADDPISIARAHARGATARGATDRLTDFARAGDRAERERLRKTDIAKCVFFSAYTATFLTRAGLALNAAVRDCNPFSLHLNGERGRMICSVDITGIIGSFAWTARVLAGALSACPVEPLSPKAMCVGDTTTVIAAVAGVASSGASFELSCGRRGLPPEDISRGILAAEGRRLGTSSPEEDVRLV